VNPPGHDLFANVRRDARKWTPPGLTHSPPPASTCGTTPASRPPMTSCPGPAPFGSAKTRPSARIGRPSAISYHERNRTVPAVRFC
jgi:hypothetical protein